ncbi:alcohol dehydrogenase catalytic domain-containing protein [Spirosoma sp. RP8]|uniref:Alcohol dehydrogenase catalytic domain-containing protein n=1 Tax=Spirosoma liriopis TaxID=2937440 RepID=A0ABT0HTK3_9BACT|nr:alcohol dehydrogenase catalytic domain-containing protein [Spirosoma liriopis]MCK8494840.1 alcohol dehydrogenase catalytic domain-containing protein [Spirosoma liriopis]
MRAIVLNEFGGVDQLVITDVPKPTIKEDEVLIKVKAISINPVDVKTRAGKGIAGRLRDNRPLIIGWDISGTITEVGEQVTDFKIGRERSNPTFRRPIHSITWKRPIYSRRRVKQKANWSLR